MFPRQTNRTESFDTSAASSAIADQLIDETIGSAQKDEKFGSAATDWLCLTCRTEYHNLATPDLRAETTNHTFLHDLPIMSFGRLPEADVEN